MKKDTKQVIFKVGEEEFGLDIMLVNAIEKYTNVIRIPNSPECIKGVINLRGEVIPVYSLRNKFGLKEAEITDKTKLIVTKSKGILLAYEVDEVKEIVEIPKEDIFDAPAIVKNASTEYIEYIANVQGRMIILLYHDGMITNAEKEVIDSMDIDQ